MKWIAILYLVFGMAVAAATLFLIAECQTQERGVMD
jgi:hypothetical protein